MKQLFLYFYLIVFSFSKGNDKIPLTTSLKVDNAIEKENFGNIKTDTKCVQNCLSNQFDLSLIFKSFTDPNGLMDSCFLIVFVKDKMRQVTLDTIYLTSQFLIGGIFSDCENMASYSTNFNTDRAFVDNYYGDLVVADLNFDHRDDIALLNESGGNSGPSYSFYIQSGDQKFILDKFLTDSVVYFPDKIDSLKKQIVTRCRAGVCCLDERVYQLDITSNSWLQTSHHVFGE